MVIFVLTGQLLIIGYLVLLVIFKRAFAKDHGNKRVGQAEFIDISATILVPCYNDAKEIGQLLASVQNQIENGGQTEFIVINDYSDAKNTEQLHQYFKGLPQNFKLLNNENSPGKKNALAYGIAQAKGDVIIQTDADCILQNYFLKEILEPFTKPEIKLTLGLVEMRPLNSFWSKLASLDFLSLQFVGLANANIGRAFMGNGAALAFRKSIYETYSEYGREWSSGDDVFLIQAVKKENPNAISIAPKAKVVTHAPKNLKHFITQRVRWGAKTDAYLEVYPKVLAIMVTLVNWFLVFYLVLSVINPKHFLAFLVGYFLKLAIELFILMDFAKQTEQKMKPSTWLSSIFYPFYITITTLLILLVGSKFTWKGRKLKA